MQRALRRLILCLLVVFSTTLRGAPLGFALDLDGVDDRVEIDLDESRPQLDYTLAAWVYLRSGGTWDGKRTAVIAAAECGQGVELLIRSDSDYSGDPQYLELGHCEKFNGMRSTLPVPLQTWTHVAVTVTSGGVISYFINGEPAGSWNASERSIAPEHLRLGTAIRLGNNSAQRQFDGRLDEVLILSQAMDPATIKNSYNLNLLGTEFPFVFALYSFDEGPGDQTLDRAPGGGFAHGNLLGGPLWVQSGASPSVVITAEGAQQDLGAA